MTPSQESCDVLSDIRSFALDDDTATVLITDLIPDAVQTVSNGNRSLLVQGRTGDLATIELNGKGRIKRVRIPLKLKGRFIEIMRAAVQETALAITSTTLTGYRPLEKYYRVDGWVQLRPTDTIVIDQTLIPRLEGQHIHGIPHSFVLEAAYASAPSLPLLDSRRRTAALAQARLLVSAFLDLRVFQPRTAFAHVRAPMGGLALAQFEAPYLKSPPVVSFSDISAFQELQPINHAEYFGRLGIGRKEFEVPDMRFLKSKFDALVREDRSRFLRSCAFLWDGASPELGDGARIGSMVSAIEALLPSGERCVKCKSHSGISDTFKLFVRKFVPSMESTRPIYEKLYASRSLIAHGAFHPEVDELMFGLGIVDVDLTDLASWGAAKAGAINWLVGGGNSVTWW